MLPNTGMHARELVELAAIVSANGPVLIQSGPAIPEDSINEYWIASKVRLDRWAWNLKRFVELADTDARRRQAQWPAVRGVLEEILAAEVLTRVWTAVLCAYDRRRGANGVESVARSVMIGHMEARHRVLALMVRGPGIDAEDAMKLNRLRCRAERWTDLLVGQLAGIHDVSEFTIDPRRAKDFAIDIGCGRGPASAGHVWPLLMASLRAAFQRGLSAESPSADLNARVAAAILACYPPELFDSTGLMRSLWMTRLCSIADDTQGMIEQLLAAEPPATSPKRGPSSGVSGGRRRDLWPF